MTKKAVEVSESGPRETFKNPKRPEKQGGPQETGKHENPDREAGAYVRNKPLVHVEDTNHHSGRKHPAVDRLPGAELLGGKLRKADEAREK